MNAQIITTPSGERLAIVPEREFLAMQAALEDKMDVDTVKSFEQNLAEGNEELVPSTIANRLIDGENPIRVWRDHRGIKAIELAKLTDTSQSHISSIETGQREASVSLLKKLAEVLSVNVDDLIS